MKAKDYVPRLLTVSIAIGWLAPAYGWKCNCTSALAKLVRSPFGHDGQTRPLFESEALSDLLDKSNEIKRAAGEIKDRLDPPNDSDDEVTFFSRKKKKRKDKPLSKAERKELTDRLQELKAQENDIAAKIEKQKDQDRGQLLAYIAQRKKTDATWQSEFQDHLTAASLYRLDGGKTVSLLVGNATEKPTPELEKQVRSLAEKIAAKGYTVLYDADSNLAPVIAKAAGVRGLGLSGSARKSTSDQSVITVVNPYVRLWSFTQADKVITSPDSVSGMGLMFLGKTSMVLDPSHSFDNPLHNWYKAIDSQLDLHLGLHFDHVPQSGSAKSALNDLGLVDVKPQTFHQYRPEDLSWEELVGGLTQADGMTIGNLRLNGLGGAVYIGSGQETPFDSQIDDVARGLSGMGIPAITGGAGGTMGRVNKVAYLTGVESVGVPITGTNQLPTEKTVLDKYHTLTVPTGNYEQRIPLLMKQRQLIVVNPGGGGTMQEIGTVLVDLAANPNRKQQILLVGKKYYQPLLDGLIKSGKLPKDIKDRVGIVDDGNEAQTLVKRWLREGRLDPRLLATTPPQPRPEPSHSRAIDGD